jgi:hypothetical protein
LVSFVQVVEEIEEDGDDEQEEREAELAEVDVRPRLGRCGRRRLGLGVFAAAAVGCLFGLLASFGW